MAGEGVDNTSGPVWLFFICKQHYFRRRAHSRSRSFFAGGGFYFFFHTQWFVRPFTLYNVRVRPHELRFAERVRQLVLRVINNMETWISQDRPPLWGHSKCSLSLFFCSATPTRVRVFSVIRKFLSSSPSSVSDSFLICTPFALACKFRSNLLT